MSTGRTDAAHAWTSPDDVDEAWSARRGAAQAVRALVDALLRAEDDISAMETVAALARQATALLRPGSSAAEAWAAGTWTDNAANWVDRTALSGRCNPIAPPMTLTWHGDRSSCDLTLTEAYTGAPGMVHGGVIAGCFDQIAGHCMVLSGHHGFTTELDIRYRRPARIGRSLRFEATIFAVDDARVHIHARCLDGPLELATARAAFARLDPHLARAVIDRSARRGPPEEP